MTKIYIPAKKPEDWKPLLGDPDLHWKPGRSAMATAYSWQMAKGLPHEINNLFERAPELLLAIPEHKVQMPKGRGQSQCDVFALVRLDGKLAVLAVEAKVDETFGPTVEQWLNQGGDNRPPILEAICELIGASFPPPGHLRYQLFHRTAAAVIEARRFNAPLAFMIVQSFSKDHAWFEAFEAFSAYLLGKGSPRGVMSEKQFLNDVTLRLAWASGSNPF